MKMKLFALAMVAVGLGTVGVLSALPADQPAPKADAKAKADPPKAAKPDELAKEDFGRLPRDKRPKLVETYQANVAMRRPIWSPDGKSVLVWSLPVPTLPGAEGKWPKPLSVARELPAIGVTVAGWPYPSSVVGFYDNGKTLVTYAPSDGINAVNRLVGISFPQLMTGSGREQWKTELEPEDGRPLAISPDGEWVFTRPMPGAKAVGGGRSDIRMLDAGTGEPIREVVTADTDAPIPVHIAFSADVKRVVLAYRAPKGFTLKAVNTADGKLVWERNIEGVFLPIAGQIERLIVHTKHLAVTVAAVEGSEREEVPRTLRLFDAETGKDRIAIADQGNFGGHARAFSHDGRLLVGTAVDQIKTEVQGGFGMPGGVPPGGRGGRGGAPGAAGGQGMPGRVQVSFSYALVVWDATTGKQVKRWEINRSEPDVAFAPNRPLLAISDFQSLPDKVSTLGFWDFSGLLK